MLRMHAAVAALAAALAGTIGAGTAAATLPIGDQFRVSTTGTDGDANRGVGRGPDLAYNPRANEYLVVWKADGLATDGEDEVFGQRVSVGGAELGGDFRISNVNIDGNPNRDAFEPSVAYNPRANEYLVVWRGDGLLTDDETEVFGQRLSAGGAELGGDFRISTTGSDGSADRDVEDPAVAYNLEANEYLVAWEADGLATGNEREVFGQRLSADGAELGGDFRISTTGIDGDANRGAFNAAVAYHAQANEYLVAWIGDGLATDDEYELFGQRLSATGAELGGDFRISTTGSDGDVDRQVGDPALAYNSQAGEYLVAWEADGLATVGEVEVFGQRLSAAGAELGGDFRISTTGSDGDATRGVEDPVVAYNAPANEYLVAWEADGLATDNETEMFGQRLSAAGTPFDGDFRISVTGSDADMNRGVEEPTVAYSPQANEYLVAWTADALATDNEFEVFARRAGRPPQPPAPPEPPAEPPPAGADTIAPLVSGLVLSRERFRVGGQPTPLTARRKRRAKAGTTISYGLSEDARVTFAIERTLAGRLKRVRGRRRCVKPTRTLVRRKAKRCQRYRPAGVLTRQATSGANRLAFSGRVGTRALRPGGYRLTLQATDAAGNTSRDARRSFTIVRIPRSRRGRQTALR